METDGWVQIESRMGSIQDVVGDIRSWRLRSEACALSKMDSIQDIVGDIWRWRPGCEACALGRRWQDAVGDKMS